MNEQILNDAERIAREIVAIDLQAPEVGDSEENDQIVQLAVERDFLIEALVETIRPEFAEDGHNADAPLTPTNSFYFQIAFRAGCIVGFEHAKDAFAVKEDIERRRRRALFRVVKHPKSQ